MSVLFSLLVIPFNTISLSLCLKLSFTFVPGYFTEAIFFETDGIVIFPSVVAAVTVTWGNVLITAVSCAKLVLVAIRNNRVANYYCFCCNTHFA
jgi:hypothetical protein